MAVPDFQSVMLPLLRLVGDGRDWSMRQTIDRLGEEFSLSSDERAQLLPSGRQALFDNRVHWAKFYLTKTGLLSQVRRGIIRITERGRATLADPPSRIDLRFLAQFPEFQRTRERRDAAPGPTEAPDMLTLSPGAQATPDERIDLAASQLDIALREDLLVRLKLSDPRFFERVVIDVLKALGYGAGSGGMAEVTGGSGDGGIDGVIDEDRLGLDRIYVQAKRYGEQAVGAAVIQNFIGALQMRGANKGVLITTSRFSSQAESTAKMIPAMRIVLIDGDRLAALMIRHNVGVRTERTVEIKKLDFDYFEPDAV